MPSAIRSLPVYPPEQIIARLEPLLTAARVRRLQSVLAERSDHVAFVFEHMIDPHNLSAALRSLDAFSFQDVHLVRPGDRLAFGEGDEPEGPETGCDDDSGLSRGITIGADRWLSVHRAPDTPSCLDGLKQAGYTVVASHLDDASAVALEELPLTRRTALVFGNEHLGVSKEVLAHADGTFRIPMHGFVQSLNLSVSVAICAYHARRALQRLEDEGALPGGFGLSAARRQALYAEWLRLSVKSAERILAEPESGPTVQPKSKQVIGS